MTKKVYIPFFKKPNICRCDYNRISCLLFPATFHLFFLFLCFIYLYLSIYCFLFVNFVIMNYPVRYVLSVRISKKNDLSQLDRNAILIRPSAYVKLFDCLLFLSLYFRIFLFFFCLFSFLFVFACYFNQIIIII